jgi:hypothetical protein
MFNIPVPELPDPNRPRYQPLPHGTFPAASLSVWLDLAKQAKVPFIEAALVGELDIKALLHFEEQEDPQVQATLAQLDQINTSLPDGHMLRWDCCAGFETKLRMGDGEPPVGEERYLHPGEPRTFDLLYDFPADQICVWQRPWVDAMVHEAFPVEFRVFVVQGKVAGIANYYLQRDLPATPAIEALAIESLAQAEAIVGAMLESQRFPAMPNAPVPQTLDRSAIDCTLDFLTTPKGDVLFLEAGPGYGFGAHPCAFLEGNTVAPIEGLKLASGAPATALAELTE